MFLALLPSQCLPIDNTQMDRQSTTQRYYDRKHVHLQPEMLLSTLESIAA